MSKEDVIEAYISYITETFFDNVILRKLIWLMGGNLI
jgi:hypothetical protein